MIIIANSSPLIALGRLNRLDIFKGLFENIHIPDAVYRETVLETAVEVQKEAILKSIKEKHIIVIDYANSHVFKRKLHPGEQAVLGLAMEMRADAVIIDDRKARNEIIELGLQAELFYTTEILKGAEKRGLISSYVQVIEQLRLMNIFLPQ